MKSSQNSQILAHLEAGNSITPLEALHKFDSLRLGARIKDLRDAGHNIHTETVHQNGKHFANYTLTKASD